MKDIVYIKKLQKRKHYSATYVVFLLFLFASIDLFQFKGKTFFFYIGIFFIIYSVLKKRELYLLKDPLIIAIFAEFFISGFLAQLSELSDVYKKTAIVMPILVMPIYIESGIFQDYVKKNRKILYTLVKGIKCACLIQFVYIPIQYILYHWFKIDLNKEIFVNFLGLVENASFVRSWIWYPSGLTYHSAVIAPLMVLGIVFFDNIFIWVLIFLDSVLCGSSTALVGVVITIVLQLLFSLLSSKGNIKFKKRVLDLLLVLIILLIVLFFTTDLLWMVSEKICYVFNRLFGSSKDGSTSAHLEYFTLYPQIFSESSEVQKLFGYGYNCSGYIFTMMDGRYNIGTWSVESEVMDRLLSLGIVGFFLYSIFLLKITLTGVKIDYRYMIVMIAIMIQGFGYNVQWDYVFLIELIFYSCIKMGINIFDFR